MGDGTSARRLEPSEVPTPERILDAALASFGSRGYDGTSLDALGAALGMSKQAILYWFGSKEGLLDALIDRSARELADVLELALVGADGGWAKVEAVVRSAFRLAGRRPELLGLVREVSRLGPGAALRLVSALQPLIERATAFLEAEMDAGRLRRHDPTILLLASYSAVTGVATEVEVLRALGVEPDRRSLARRRRALIDLLRAALVPAPMPG